MFENMDNEAVKTEEPVTPFSKLGEFLKKNAIHLSIGIGIIVLVIVVFSLDGCDIDSETKIAVPDEWIQDYFSYYYKDNEEEGSRSYSFFANMVRGLTQVPFLKYDLDELTYAEDYAFLRNQYITEETNLDIEHGVGILFKPNNYVNVSKATFMNLTGIPEFFTLEDYKGYFENSITDMKAYGIHPFSDLFRRKNQDDDPHNLSITFLESRGPLVDSEMLLNLYVPPVSKVKRYVPYEINREKGNKNEKRLYLKLTKEDGRFNNGIRFQRPISNPKNDVEKGSAAAGFYLKYRDIPLKDKCQEVDINIGKVYMIWSPNIPADELQWIHSNYILNCIADYRSVNSSIQKNDCWLPSGYPKAYIPTEVWSYLNDVENQKKTTQKAPRQNKTVQIYFDTNDISHFVNLLVKRSDSRLKFKRQKAVSNQSMLSLVKSADDKKRLNDPIIYIYGVSLHSMFNLPTEVISRSFWYKEHPESQLYKDAKDLVENFGEKMAKDGYTIDEGEYRQYADLERALCLGLSNSRRKGGWQPLFTVPYALIWNKDKIKSISFNSSRGFLELIDANPPRKK